MFKLPSKPGEIRKLAMDNLALGSAINDIERLAIEKGIDIHPILDRYHIKYCVESCLKFNGET